ncbi:MAG TPA: DUF1553 domain-containing protein [Verrucomicrobiae bacterium]|nr:DUF1553 domain-containing protein [Verrucomicrobiae bacterium]
MRPATIFPLIFCAVWCAFRAAFAASVDEVWDARVAPLLDRYCWKCHAGVRQKGELDLRSLETILRGGEHGPALIPAKPEESRMIQYVAADSDPHMPPEGKKQLSKEEIAVFRDWVQMLPIAPEASSASTNIGWVPQYIAELRQSQKQRAAPPQAMPVSEAIDAILQADWDERNIKPASLSNDRAFVRRVYLDLAGRIPTPAELESFITNGEPKKREHLVNSLLESADYPRHMREVFDVVLMGRPKRNSEGARRGNGWYEFLEYAFRTNLPWSDVVQDIILARATNAPMRGASQFLYERRNNFQAMAEAMAPIAFGVEINCAQCHNHPLAWEIEQRHYWGLVAAFNRSKNVETSSGIGLAESAVGGFVQFANLKKESQPAILAFLNGRVIDEKRPGENEKEDDSPALYLVPPPKEKEKAIAPAQPKFSRREALASAVTEENPLLARSFVNRIWAILMGQGIVNPPDQIDSRHRSSHPILLEWLSENFERSGYDVKRLIRGIVLSRAYQPNSKTPGRAPPPANSFARALDKPLSAEQLLESVLVATGHYPLKESEGVPDREELRRLFVKTFPDFMPVVYNPTLEQALFWSNSPKLDALLKPHGDSTAAQLLALSSAQARIEKAFGIVLGREPDREEAEQLKPLLLSAPPEEAVKNLLWTLLASAEFQLNH